jgi:predicted AAA+ superfamily ATPase
MPYHRRALATVLGQCLRSFPAVLVTGARQAGKTTLLREELGRTHAYVSLDTPAVRARALADPIAFLRELDGPAILDEIQAAPGLLPYVKQAIDADRRSGRWVLSGSQSFPLMRGVSETMAGRVAVLTLDPFSTAEAVGVASPANVASLLKRVFGRDSRATAPSQAPELVDWILTGGYPRVRLTRGAARRAWFPSYVQTYLQRDVRDLLQVGDLDAFARFLAMCAARTAQVINMSDISRDLGVAVPTIKRWLSVLEASHVIALLPPHHRNLGKRVVKAPRLFFTDVGLATHLSGLTSRAAVINGPSFGALVETAVMAEWMKAFHQRGESAPLFHWRSSAGLEVDLVIEHDARLHGIEVKSTATPTPKHAERLARWLELAGPEARGVVACNVAAPMALAPGIRAVPWHLAW